MNNMADSYINLE